MPRIRKSLFDSLEVSSAPAKVILRTYENRRGPDGPYQRQHVRSLTLDEARTLAFQLNGAIADADAKANLHPDALILLGLA